MSEISTAVVIYIMVGLIVENFLWHSIDRQSCSDLFLGAMIVFFWPLFVVLIMVGKFKP